VDGGSGGAVHGSSCERSAGSGPSIAKREDSAKEREYLESAIGDLKEKISWKNTLGRQACNQG
jgi:hypothetical protein